MEQADLEHDFWHETDVVVDPVDDGAGVFDAIEGRRFNEAIVSWNVDVPDGAGFVIEARVARALAPWSPWLRFGRFGPGVDATPAATTFEDGAVEVDIFRAQSRFERIQVRMRVLGDLGGVRMRRLAVCVSDTLPGREFRQQACQGVLIETRKPPPVPFRSQHSAAPELAPRVCSPACVAMVMEAYGVARTTAEVAARAYDAEHDLYGNWANAVQAAYSFGVPGYVTRIMNDFYAFEALYEGQPLIASVAFDHGQLRDSPIPSSKGHLIVLTGVAADGGFHANDPAAVDAKRGQVVYRAEDLVNVWILRGGIAYVLLDPSEPTQRRTF
jgi:hypothetical protein